MKKFIAGKYPFRNIGFLFCVDYYEENVLDLCYPLYAASSRELYLVYMCEVVQKTSDKL
jgi:hypothetical protein